MILTFGLMELQEDLEGSLEEVVEIAYELKEDLYYSYLEVNPHRVSMNWVWWR